MRSNRVMARHVTARHSTSQHVTARHGPSCKCGQYKYKSKYNDMRTSMHRPSLQDTHRPSLEGMSWGQWLHHRHHFGVGNDSEHVVYVTVMGLHGEEVTPLHPLMPGTSHLYTVPYQGCARITITYVDQNGIERWSCTNILIRAGNVWHVRHVAFAASEHDGSNFDQFTSLHP